MNSGSSSVLPSRAKPSMNISRLEMPKVRSRNKCRSMMGSLCRHSQKTTKINEAAADHGKNHDEVRFEPVVALAFVEDDLQRSQAERDKAEADVVDLGFAQLAAVEIWRILNQPRGEQDRKNADRNVDEENPAPGEIVGDPSAERRTDGRRRDHGDAIDGECHAALGGRKSVGQNGLLAGLQAAAARALQNAADDQRREIRRQSAQERTDR